MEAKANITATENQAGIKQVSIEEQLMKLMHNHGLQPAETPVADGKLHRIHDKQDKPGKKDIWYVLYNNGKGCFGHWARMFEKQNFNLSIDSSLTPSELNQINTQYEQQKNGEPLELQFLRAECREKAAKILDVATDASNDHAYLVRKKVKAHGIKEYKGSLVIPVHNNGVLVGLQFIPPDGEKKFLKGTQTTGSYFCMFGDGDGNTIYIAEGYATGATIHEMTGNSVVVAFNCGNIEAIAKIVKSVHPESDLVICADNDHLTTGNPGLTKAKAAALATGAKLAVPTFPAGSTGTDFNDMASAFVAGGAL